MGSTLPGGRGGARGVGGSECVLLLEQTGADGGSVGTGRRPPGPSPAPGLLQGEAPVGVVDEDPVITARLAPAGSVRP